MSPKDRHGTGPAPANPAGAAGLRLRRASGPGDGGKSALKPVRHGEGGSTARAFSLVELLVVLVILCVLIGLSWAPAQRAAARRAREHCALQLRQMHVALELYARDHGGGYPALPSVRTAEPVLSLLVPRYTVATATFVCPASGDHPPPEAVPFAAGRISYAYYQGRRATEAARDPLVSDEQINSTAKTPGDPVFSPDGRPPGNNHGRLGGNVLFGDGSVRFTPPVAAFPLPLGPGVALLNPRR
ncbi:prepilin-type N-terminal cleavage/methylation domain-containing protein [Limisphaera sp. VF-2]|mgnify:CR=1 FL=1|jgi:prepilin-type N-terminal cleavage/methylation domain-containing protein/prepilin-type processing-associated H-X9-DG protein|uniref:prepilin-type N-terminal cleavage/methylation domain-containing protein n=1 Tax=Limisphaera sp. VF-2 TaxID=3400418 RepID=UPI0017756A72|nr:prepilin-type N-terminal cleavage/methylation domain-containing protein [Limisphaera sp.]